MAILVQQSEATAAYRRMYFHCVDATDGITPETGEAGGQPQISLNGAAWGNTTNTLVAIGNGRYYVELVAATEVNSLGIIEGRYKSANTAESIGTTLQVVPFDPYSATRGLAGTALPDAVADAAFGLPISDAGGLDLDAKLANTNEITAARMGALTDWINGGRLDLILDIIAADTTNDIPWLIAALETSIITEIDANETKIDALPTAAGIKTAMEADGSKLDHLWEMTEDDAGTRRLTTNALEQAPTGGGDATAANQTTILSRIGTPANIDGGGADLSNNIKKIVDDNAGADFDATNHSLHAIRTRGDAAWITGGGGAITQMIYPVPLIPSTIDLADTATVRIGLGVVNMLDDLPTTAEITPGTITIDRKAVGGSSWTNVVNAAACLEAAGLIYYDEVFDDDTGYRPGDTIRVTFKGQKITVDANDHELVPADGWIFHTYIRGAERTDIANAAHTYTVLDGDGNGIADVLVEAKINDVLIQSARTNTSGIATFYLAPGTYDFYATKAGFSFTNPDSETVS